MNDSLPSCRVLEITSETAVRYAELRSELKRAGAPIPSNDAWIAALCRQHSLPLLSKDRHFDVVKGIRRVEW
jgi:predicted nucleic acid-binding protein